jgi:hypothetical protein
MKYTFLKTQFNTFVFVAVLDEVSENGEFETNLTFQAHKGNLSCCYGLASQASKDIDRKIKEQVWDSE